MERRPPSAADELSLKILAFLHENCSQGFTAKELAMEHTIYSSPDKVQEKIRDLLRKGLVRVQNRGRDIVYQIVL